ncbi:uncharacterized protein LOC134247100 [Saccostrea cucullata]|uniref:uncharacterized protein LOC134247100 n=1 Tax=Saccostrea cuccullata TaxID=36930 RepID=UPI002ED1B8C7
MAVSKPKYPLGSPQEHIEMCGSHELPIDMMCEDCDKFICGKCAKTDHKDHEWNTLSTAATQRRRGLLKFLTKIREGDLPGIDEKIEMVSKQITENEELCDSEIKKLQKHVDEIMARLLEIRNHNEEILRGNLEKKNEKLKSKKSEMNKKKKEIQEVVKFMEDNKSTMSDFSLIDNHRELTKMLSGPDVDIKNYKHSARYSKGEISDEVLKNMTGKTLDLDDFSLTETNSFKYGDDIIRLLEALCEDHCYIGDKNSPYFEQLVNTEGEIKYRYNIASSDMCVTDTSDVYFTDFSNNSISRLSPSGSVSTVISADPLRPVGICQSVDSGLLVTLRDDESGYFKLDSHSRRLVRHITVTGEVIREYEYQEDGQTRLFTYPVRVTQNSNSDICVLNFTNPTTGDLVIISPSGRMKSIYHGQNLTEDFFPADIVCDSLCNILVTDLYNKQIHILSPDGEFLKFLLTENEVNSPYRLSLYKSTLWVGYYEGLVEVFRYKV